MRSLKYCLLSYLLIQSVNAYAQTYTEGVFDVGVISIKSTNEEVDSAMLDMIKSNLESEMGMIVYFNKDRVAIEESNPFGSKSRQVYDLESKKVY